MNLLSKLLLLFFLINNTALYSREIGQTEITTDGGVEVFKQEKYYLLKENVIINSDNFKLNADLVKAYFEKDLYDIIRIDAEGQVTFKTSSNLNGSGSNVDINTINETIFIFGENSILNNSKTIMNSDESILVNNKKGNFKIKGKGSRLINDEIDITGNYIEGSFINENDQNIINNLFVKSDNQINIKTNTLDMYSLTAKYNKKDDIIELFDNVKIFRDNELITGNYAKINTITETYKVKSKDSEKVKILLNTPDE
tara:strand:+ start:524 stop:1291 length:768 start_codon:yes stop_codon:yes gene_type:complete